jgi:hypothetical protein
LDFQKHKGEFTVKVYAALVGLLLLAVSAFAADVDGKWKGSLSTPNGDIPIGFTLKADGAALTGSMTGMDGNDIAIKEGKIDGANISFSVTLDFGGMPFKLSYKGVVSADDIKFTGDAGGMPFELVVKKDK